MDIDEFVLDSAWMVARQFNVVERKLFGIPHKLYRYEDVIFDKLAWTNDRLAYLDLTVRPKVVERVIARNDERPQVEDVARHVRKVVPGDHADKLKPDTIAALNSQLAPTLARYGYA